MSAFDRLPAPYRVLCDRFANQAGVSPQNRRVRMAADTETARARHAQWIARKPQTQEIET